MASMLEFRTAGFNPYAVKYSPYYDSRIAVASAANYGIVGNGRLFCLGLGPQGIQVEKTYEIKTSRVVVHLRASFQHC
jgi:peroxin-7